MAGRRQMLRLPLQPIAMRNHGSDESEAVNRIGMNAHILVFEVSELWSANALHSTR